MLHAYVCSYLLFYYSFLILFFITFLYVILPFAIFHSKCVVATAKRSWCSVCVLGGRLAQNLITNQIRDGSACACASHSPTAGWLWSLPASCWLCRVSVDGGWLCRRWLGFGCGIASSVIFSRFCCRNLRLMKMLLSATDINI